MSQKEFDWLTESQIMKCQREGCNKLTHIHQTMKSVGSTGWEEKTHIDCKRLRIKAKS